MSSADLPESIAVIEQTFPRDHREGQVCSLIIKRLSELKEGFEGVTLGSVAADLGWYDAEGKRAIATALDYLSYGEVPLLERRFELWPAETGEVLAQPICSLDEDVIRRALETNVLLVPSTGEELHDFKKQVSVHYAVTAFALGLVSRDGAKK